VLEEGPTGHRAHIGAWALQRHRHSRRPRTVEQTEGLSPLGAVGIMPEGEPMRLPAILAFVGGAGTQGGASACASGSNGAPASGATRYCGWDKGPRTRSARRL